MKINPDIGIVETKLPKETDSHLIFPKGNTATRKKGEVRGGCDLFSC